MGTQNIKAQVHLVATDKRAADFNNIGEKKLFFNSKGQLIYYPICQSAAEIQHLYFTTDEEAKDTDWVLPNAPWDNGPWKYKKAPCPLPYWGGTKDSYRKIVATINPELSFNAGQKHIGQVPPHERFPMIDTPFIEAYIKAYNEGNPIKEVLLEIIPNSKGDIADGGKYNFLKLRPNGSVIIHPVKERMYTREEVKDIILALNKDKTRKLTAYLDGLYSIEDQRETSIEWFDKNYPE